MCLLHFVDKLLVSGGALNKLIRDMFGEKRIEVMSVFLRNELLHGFMIVFYFRICGCHISA